MINNINGINEDLIDILIKDIYNCSENIHKSIENINDLIDKTNYVFKSDLANELRFKYDKSKIKLDNLYKKTEDYNNVLINVKMKYQNLDYEINSKIEKYSKGGIN